MDFLQRKLFECVYEVIENVGELFESIFGKQIGVFVGNFCFE